MSCSPSSGGFCSVWLSLFGQKLVLRAQSWLAASCGHNSSREQCLSAPLTYSCQSQMQGSGEILDLSSCR